MERGIIFMGNKINEGYMQACGKRLASVILCFVIVFASIEFPLKVEASTTTIDVTGLASGTKASHDCSKYLVNKYDEDYHWKECSVCGKVYGDKEEHDLAQTDYNWGYASCYPTNTYTIYCSNNCGYAYETTDEHPSLNDWKNVSDNWFHYKQCTSCKAWVEEEWCYDADGNLLTCKNLGTCVVCGYTYTSNNITHWINTYDGYCGICGEHILDCTYNVSYSSNSSTVTVTITISGDNIKTPTNKNYYTYHSEYNISATKSVSGSSNKRTIKYTITPYDNLQTQYNFVPNINNIEFEGNTAKFYPYTQICQYDANYDVDSDIDWDAF
jgi:hypothetical protein